MTDTKPVIVLLPAPAVTLDIFTAEPGAVEVTEIPAAIVQPLEQPTTIVEVQVPGASGPAGPAGSGGSGGETVGKVLQAFEILSGHSAVRGVSATHVAKGSNDNLAHMGLIIGITLNAAIINDPVTVVSEGWIDEPTFAFAPGPVYLGVNGGLTQIAPVAGFLQQLATAVDATRILVNILPPIDLA